jgi:hypothetical protein
MVIYQFTYRIYQAQTSQLLQVLTGISELNKRALDRAVYTDFTLGSVLTAKSRLAKVVAVKFAQCWEQRDGKSEFTQRWRTFQNWDSGNTGDRSYQW